MAKTAPAMPDLDHLSDLIAQRAAIDAEIAESQVAPVEQALAKVEDMRTLIDDLAEIRQQMLPGGEPHIHTGHLIDCARAVSTILDRQLVTLQPKPPVELVDPITPNPA